MGSCPDTDIDPIFFIMWSGTCSIFPFLLFKISSSLFLPFVVVIIIIHMRFFYFLFTVFHI